MSCGAATAAAPSSAYRPAETPRGSTVIAAPKRPIGKWVGIGAACLVLAIAAGLIGWKALTNRSGTLPSNGQVLKASGNIVSGPLTEQSGRVQPVAPVAQAEGVPEQGPPADVVDYLAFLKEIERQRVALRGRHTGEVLRLSTTMTAGNLTAEMSENPEQGHKKTYDEFQATMQRVNTEWQALNAQFLQRQPPASCASLRDKYYDMLGKSAASISKVMSAVSQALGPNGDPQRALQTLSGMDGSGPGSASHDITLACQGADEALAAVCDKYRLHKDFDIKDDNGGGLSGGLLR